MLSSGGSASSGRTVRSVRPRLRSWTLTERKTWHALQFTLTIPTSRVTGILNGQRVITGDTALRLGHFFGTSPEFWLNLQSLYELRLAEQRAGKTIKAWPTLKRRKGKEERQPAHV